MHFSAKNIQYLNLKKNLRETRELLIALFEMKTISSSRRTCLRVSNLLCDIDIKKKNEIEKHGYVLFELIHNDIYYKINLSAYKCMTIKFMYK